MPQLATLDLRNNPLDNAAHEALIADREGDGTGTLFAHLQTNVTYTPNAAPVLAAIEPVYIPRDSALQFDGVDDYVDIPYSASLNTDSFTVEAWVRLDLDDNQPHPNVWFTPLMNRDFDSATQKTYGYNLYVNPDNRWQFWTGDTSEQRRWQVITGPAVTVGAWTHLARTYNAESKTMEFVVDGMSVGRISHASYSLNPISNFVIGHNNMLTNFPYGARAFPGAIDDVRVWNVVRTQQEILADIHRVLAGNEPGLVGYWRFDEGTGDTAYDLSGNGNDGILGALRHVARGAAAPEVPDGQYDPLRAIPGNQGAYQFRGGAVDVTLPQIARTVNQYNTVAFWMYWDGTAHVMPFGFETYDLVFARDAQNRDVFGFNTGKGDVYGIQAAGLANRWVHVVAVFNNYSAHSFRDLGDNELWIDGDRQTLQKLRNNDPIARIASENARIGGWRYNNDYRFRGFLDEVAVYNKKLSDADIASLYGARSGDYRGTAMALSPIAYYRFDEPGGPVAYDSTANGNHGSTGIPVWVDRGPRSATVDLRAGDANGALYFTATSDQQAVDVRLNRDQLIVTAGADFRGAAQITVTAHDGPGGPGDLRGRTATQTFDVHVGTGAIYGTNYDDFDRRRFDWLQYTPSPAGGEFLVNTYTTDDQRFASVAMDASGNFVVVWESGGQDGSGFGAYAQRYNAQGQPQGGESRVNTNTASQQWYPSVAMDASGSFVVVWHNSYVRELDPPNFSEDEVVFYGVSGKRFGTWDANERGVEGRTIYLDLDSSGTWDAGEPRAITDPGGHYMFDLGALELEPGTYTVAELLPDQDPYTPGVQSNWIATGPVFHYFNDFEAPLDAGNWSSTLSDGPNDQTSSAYAPRVSSTPTGARRFLGEFANDKVTLTLSGLPEHTGGKVAFDLFVIRSWDGSEVPSGNPAYGPDNWQLYVDGDASQPLINTTFANNSYRQQYPKSFEAGTEPAKKYPARTGAVENNSLGYVHGSSVMDSVYHIESLFAHTGSTVALSFAGSNLEGLGNESWGIDNVRVVLYDDQKRPVSASHTVNVGGVATGVDFGNFRVVDAGPDRWGQEGQPVELEATLRDPDGSNGSNFTVVWQARNEADGTVVWTSNSQRLSFTSDGVGVPTATVRPQEDFIPPDDGTYRVILTVTDQDDSNTTYAGMFLLVVKNAPPRLTAPGNQTAEEGAATLFDLGSFAGNLEVGDGSGGWDVTVDWGDNTQETFHVNAQGELPPPLAHLRRRRHVLRDGDGAG